MAIRHIVPKLRRKVTRIVKNATPGKASFQPLQYSDIAANSISPEMTAKLKDRGACVVRNTIVDPMRRQISPQIAADF